MDCRSGSLRLDSSSCRVGVLACGVPISLGGEAMVDGADDRAWLSMVAVFCEKPVGAPSAGIIANGIMSPVPISIRASEKVVMVASDL